MNTPHGISGQDDGRRPAAGVATAATVRSPAPSSSTSPSLRSLGVVLAVSCAVLVGYVIVLRGASAPTERWLSDDYDRDAYHRIAQWLPTGRVPYRDVPSEYPTLATLAFAAPYSVSGGSDLTKEGYRQAWTVLMAGVLLATVMFVAGFRRRLGLRPEAALLLLLPSPLYFSLMRYDVLCAALLCVSLAAFGRARYVLAHILLALATFVKWYPAVVFPVYLAFHWSHEGLSWRRPSEWARSTLARAGGAYVLTAAVITGISVAWFTWDGFLVPYRFHAYRSGQYFNPYWLLEQYRATLGLDRFGWWIVNGAFLALQLAIVPILLFKRIRTMTDVFRYGLLAICLFIAFARVDSPQWILWYVPPALMFASRASTLSAVAVLCVWNYVLFPVAFDAYENDVAAPMFTGIVLVKDMIVITLIVLIFRERVPAPGEPATA